MRARTSSEVLEGASAVDVSAVTSTSGSSFSRSSTASARPRRPWTRCRWRRGRCGPVLGHQRTTRWSSSAKMSGTTCSTRSAVRSQAPRPAVPGCCTYILRSGPRLRRRMRAGSGAGVHPDPRRDGALHAARRAVGHRADGVTGPQFQPALLLALDAVGTGEAGAFVGTIFFAALAAAIMPDMGRSSREPARRCRSTATEAIRRRGSRCRLHDARPRRGGVAADPSPNVPPKAPSATNTCPVALAAVTSASGTSSNHTGLPSLSHANWTGHRGGLSQSCSQARSRSKLVRPGDWVAPRAPRRRDGW